MKLFAGWWLFLLAIYLLLVGKVSVEETAAGFAAAGVAVIALTVLRMESAAKFKFHPAWFAFVARAFGDAIRGCGVMLRAICLRPFRTRGNGKFGWVDFDAGKDSPVSNARRALVIAGVSLSPDGFVLGIDRAKNRLMLHRYGRRRSKPESKMWPL